MSSLSGTILPRDVRKAGILRKLKTMKKKFSLSVTFKESNGSCYATELQTDLKRILDDGTLFDVGLRIGSEVIRAHKIILSARSAVFRAMFTKDMKETIDSTVVIEDLSVETVRKLVLYMYTDTVPDCQWEDMKELYFAADKYQMQVLKKKCVTFLKANLSVPNVCEALILADLHRDADLKAASLDFISEHNSAVFDSAEWKEMGKNNSSLALEVADEICSNKRIKLN